MMAKGCEFCSFIFQLFASMANSMKQHSYTSKAFQWKPKPMCPACAEKTSEKGLQSFDQQCSSLKVHKVRSTSHQEYTLQTVFRNNIFN